MQGTTRRLRRSRTKHRWGRCRRNPKRVCRALSRLRNRTQQRKAKARNCQILALRILPKVLRKGTKEKQKVIPLHTREERKRDGLVESWRQHRNPSTDVQAHSSMPVRPRTKKRSLRTLRLPRLGLRVPPNRLRRRTGSRKPIRAGQGESPSRRSSLGWVDHQRASEGGVRRWP